VTEPPCASFTDFNRADVFAGTLAAAAIEVRCGFSAKIGWVKVRGASP